MLLSDTGLGRFHLGRVRLGEQRDQLVLVGPLPVLDLGLLGQGLEVAHLHGCDMVAEELLLESELLGVRFKQFLGQVRAPGNSLFGFLHRRQKIGIAGRCFRHHHLGGRLIKGLFGLFERLLLRRLDSLLFGLFGHFLSGGFL